WQREGLEAPPAVSGATSEYRDEQNVVGRFVADCCVVADHASARSGELFEAFEGWAKREGEASMSQEAFGKRLGSDPRFVPQRSNQGRLWRGLGLRNPVEGA